MKTIETLDPKAFRGLITTIGELPSSFVDSMSYYEMIAWLVDYIKNNVIPAVNNNAEAIKEIQDWIKTLDLQDEVNNKIDEMIADGTFALIVGDALDFKADYFDVTTKAELKTALADTRTSIINVLNDLTIDEIMVVNGNTNINLGNHTITFTGTTHGFRNYIPTNQFLAYGGNSNITIRNGKITGSGSISFCHAKNINLEDIYFENIDGSHILEMMSINGLNVKRCRFKGIVAQELNRRYVEYIQVDDCTYANFPWFDEENPTYDGTPNTNWNIEDNELVAPTLDGYVFYAGIGSHTYIENNPHTNINIKNNIISGYNYAGLVFRNFQDCIIEGNKFIGGVDTVDTSRIPYAIRAYRIFKNITIKNNDVNLNQNGSMFFYAETFEENCSIIDNTVYGAYATTYITEPQAIYSYIPVNLYICNNRFYDFQTRLMNIRHTDVGSGKVIFNNNIVTYSKSSVSDWAIRMYATGTITMQDNIFNFNTLAGEVLSPNQYCTGIYWKNNMINSSDARNPHRYAIYKDGGYTGGYANVYGVILNGYAGNVTTLTSQALTVPYANFDKMIVILGAGGNTQTAQFKDFDPRAKLSGRTFKYAFGTGTGTAASVTITLNNDGTLTYSDNGTALALRGVYFVND